MNDLAQELSLALAESSKAVEQTVRRHNRKRKGKSRRTNISITEDISLKELDFPNQSEASAASDHDLLIGTPCEQQDNLHARHILSTKAVEATTDSEDQCSKITNKLSALSLPTNVLISGADPESDSVTDVPQERKCTAHARRRRRAKLNASPQSIVPQEIGVGQDMEKKRPRHHTRRREASAMETESLSLNQRKRKSQRRPSESLCGGNDVENCFDNASESSFLTSDGEVTCDDLAGEADDEQSDFFHEPGPACGLAGWEEAESRERLQRLLGGTFNHIGLPQFAYKKTVLGKYGRPFRTGRRRLKHGAVRKPVAQESSSDSIFCPPPVKSSCADREAKRRKKLQVPTSSCMDLDTTSLGGRKFHWPRSTCSSMSTCPSLLPPRRRRKHATLVTNSQTTSN